MKRKCEDADDCREEETSEQPHKERKKEEREREQGT